MSVLLGGWLEGRNDGIAKPPNLNLSQPISIAIVVTGDDAGKSKDDLSWAASPTPLLSLRPDAEQRADVWLKRDERSRLSGCGYNVSLRFNGSAPDNNSFWLANDGGSSDECLEARRLAFSWILGRIVALMQAAASHRQFIPPATLPANPTQIVAPWVIAGSPQRNTYALIVGIEKYRDVPPATSARVDAERFAAIAKTTLGIPPEHIKFLIDERAARSDIDKALAWSRLNVPAGGRILFFFSGHGAPEPSSGTSYLVPYDGDPAQLDQSAIRVSQILKMLGSTRAKDALVLVDACFSGLGGRSVLAPGTRPLVLIKAPAPVSRVALLSAASGSEISGPAPGNSGGLFSSVVAAGLGEGHADLNRDGTITLEELFQWVKPRVAQQAQYDSRSQTPSLLLSGKTKTSDFIVASGLHAQSAR